jgi:hypothetical protein
MLEDITPTDAHYTANTSFSVAHVLVGTVARLPRTKTMATATTSTTTTTTETPTTTATTTFTTASVSTSSEPLPARFARILAGRTQRFVLILDRVSNRSNRHPRNTFTLIAALVLTWLCCLQCGYIPDGGGLGRASSVDD